MKKKKWKNDDREWGGGEKESERGIKPGKDGRVNEKGNKKIRRRKEDEAK